LSIELLNQIELVWNKTLTYDVSILVFETLEFKENY